MPDPNFTAAFKEVKHLVQPDADPVLTYGDGDEPDAEMELDACILKSLRATVWAANTVYLFGAVVMPSPRDGHRYRAIQGGTSGATQPTFQTGDAYRTSDNTVVWEEYGQQPSNTYDAGKAAYYAWQIKKSKASEYLGSDEQRIFEHCERMERSHAPVGMA